jgi:hypothetical protein
LTTNGNPVANPDRRKERRRLFTSEAQITAGPRTSVRCVMCDISASGASITLQDPEIELPERFHLVIPPGGSVRRLCRVMWRDGNRVGLQFFF